MAANLATRALSRYLVPSWKGKWDIAILGQYLEWKELSTFARLVASRRWKFSAVPSIRKTGITIELKGNRVTDKHLKSLSRLRTVHVIVLTDCRVTDVGLSHLARVASLECVVLSHTSVTDAGLIHLRALPKLQTLDVDGTLVSDSGLRAAGLLDKKFSLASIEKDAREKSAAAADDAVPTSVEIVEINRRLAAMRPDVCLPDLAISLNNLGWGRVSEQAVIALQESVTINRRLVARCEDHRPALYNGLSNLGLVLDKQGRYDDAITAIVEAIEVFEQISDNQASTDLALALQRLGNLYRKVNRDDEAVRPTRESVEMFRRRVETLPNAFMLHSWFVSSLNDLGTLLHSLGHREEALAVLTEAVGVSRQLTVSGTGRWDLITSLKNLEKILTDLGRHQEAQATNREAQNLERQAASDASSSVHNG